MMQRQEEARKRIPMPPPPPPVTELEGFGDLDLLGDFEDEFQSVVLDTGMATVKVTAFSFSAFALYLQLTHSNITSCLHSLLLLCQAGFAGDDAPRAVFPALVGRPRHQVSKGIKHDTTHTCTHTHAHMHTQGQVYGQNSESRSSCSEECAYPFHRSICKSEKLP